jgi:hypothetical protein
MIFHLLNLSFSEPDTVGGLGSSISIGELIYNTALVSWSEIETLSSTHQAADL